MSTREAATPPIRGTGSRLEGVRAERRPPRIPQSGIPWIGLTVLLAFAWFLWSGAASIPGPFPTVDDNRQDDWVAVTVYGGEGTIVLADDTRWLQLPEDPDRNVQQISGYPGFVPPTFPRSDHAALHTSDDGTTKMDIWRLVNGDDPRSWNPFRETVPRWAKRATSIPVRRLDLPAGER